MLLLNEEVEPSAQSPTNAAQPSTATNEEPEPSTSEPGPHAVPEPWRATSWNQQTRAQQNARRLRYLDMMIDNYGGRRLRQHNYDAIRDSGPRRADRALPQPQPQPTREQRERRARRAQRSEPSREMQSYSDTLLALLPSAPSPERTTIEEAEQEVREALHRLEQTRREYGQRHILQCLTAQQFEELYARHRH